MVYAVHTLAQFVHAPRKEHLIAALRVIRYIKGSPRTGIIIDRNCDIVVRGYCDADHGSCRLTRKSVTGYYVKL